MSATPSEEPGVEGRWYGSDFQKVDAFGSAAALSADLEDGRQLKDEAREQKRSCNIPESDRRPLPVVMETASTDKSDADTQMKAAGDMGDPYTSLLSGQSFSQQDTSYFSGDLDEGQQRQAGSTNDLKSSLQSVVFSSYSDLGYGSHKQPDPDKPSTYSYMDISGREGWNTQRRSPVDWSAAAVSDPARQFVLGGGCYLEKSPSPVEVETLGPAAVLDSQTFPYVEEPSDDELSDHQAYVSPVKITLTEMPPTSDSPSATSYMPPVAVSEKESILSLGLQGVPTVTLSEPEDESPGSSTPPLTEDSESPSDPVVQDDDVKTVSSARAPGASLSQTSPKQQSPSAEVSSFPSLPLYAKVVDASSGDSGDSEIELVSEESSPQAPSSGYMSFSKSPSSSPSAPDPSPPSAPAPLPAPAPAPAPIPAPAPLPAPAHAPAPAPAHAPAPSPAPAPASAHAPAPAHAPASSPAPAPAPASGASTQYSILREEREAELDSELALESCGEESPKRFPHDLTAGKGRRADTRPTEPPSPRVAAPPPASPAPPPAAPASTPREKSPSVEEKPKPAGGPAVPSAGPTELKVEQPAGGGPAERRRSSQSCRGSERLVAAPAIFWGLTREKAMELLYWRDLKQTGLVFSSVLLLLFSLTQFSVVSVIAYLALAALSATISFRVYKSVLQAVQKTDEGHPFKSYLEIEISLSHDQMQRYAEKTQYYVNSTLKELRRLFLVQDLVDSLKFAVLMWLLTYVGALFNGLTLLIMAVVSMFSMPVVYEKYQAQIDQYLGLVRTQVNSVVGKIQEKIPGAKRKAE
ncbi:reticulon-1b isoform X3 [Brachyhypopomus gauderio]|uniref:reticulon-1b isoform X3 n=1 Tax=Brachyhypopomus gauderio TaxID=698409 RepID=UPI004041EB2D